MRKDGQKIAEIKRKKQIRTTVIIAVFVCVCIAAAVVAIVLNSGDRNNSNSESTGGKFDMAKPSHYADIVIKDYGKITVALYRDAAPITVDNFISLARSGFYDGITFHRIMKGFMMQGGDPEGTGRGGSDKEIKGEFKSNGFNNPISHTRGTISMARAKDPNSASSQFFIVHEDSTFLDGDYAAFGYVTEGIEVVDMVCNTAKPIDGNGTIISSEQPVIETITIRDAS